LPATADSALRKLWLAWNSGHLAGDEWQQWLVEADRLTCHAKRWQQQLLALPDLASSLLRFARSRI
jgi:hypothetical protein